MASTKKPREIGLVFKVSEDTIVDGVRMTPEGCFELMYNGEPIEFSYTAAIVSYDRKKKKKILYKAEIDPKNPRVDIHNVITRFDELYAIDTNTFELNGVLISTVSCLSCKFTIEDIVTKIDLPIQEVTELRNLSVVEPEKFGWQWLCTCVTQQEGYNPNLKIGVIVDSYLGDLEEINSGKKPLWGHYYLPQNFTLVYATSDVATDTVANWLLKKCDSNSERVKKQIQKKWDSSSLKEAPLESLFSHHRLWIYEDGGDDVGIYDPLDIRFK